MHFAYYPATFLYPAQALITIFMTFLRSFLQISFRLHDALCDWLGRYYFQVKRGLLVLAHLSLFGFFFPDLRHQFGELSGNLLIAILFLSPLSKIFRIRILQQLMGLRRELGIMFGYLAAVHGIGYLTDPLLSPYFLEQLSSPLLAWWERPLLFGFLAFSLTLPLLFTSNNIANRLLGGRNWKWLHRSVYVMALFAVIHRFLINGLSTQALVEMTILVTAYIGAKILAWRNFLTPLVRVNSWIAGEYQLFKKPPVDSVSTTIN